jgi:hypothetical protein
VGAAGVVFQAPGGNTSAAQELLSWVQEHCFTRTGRAVLRLLSSSSSSSSSPSGTGTGSSNSSSSSSSSSRDDAAQAEQHMRYQAEVFQYYHLSLMLLNDLFRIIPAGASSSQLARALHQRMGHAEEAECFSAGVSVAGATVGKEEKEEEDYGHPWLAAGVRKLRAQVQLQVQGAAV